MNGNNTISRTGRSRIAVRTLWLGALLACLAGNARADVTADKKRALLSGVRRVAIVSPFFSVERLGKSERTDSAGSASRAPQGNAASPASDAEQASRKAQLDAYQDQLRRLTVHISGRLQERIKVRTLLDIVPTDETDRALKALDLTPEKLFADNGRIRNGRFPQPNPESVRQLAARLHVDAVLLTILDEPRRNNGHYSFNPLTGIDYSSSHVSAQGGFFMALPDGKEALHEFLSVVHPLTHVGNRTYLLVDWQEAHDLLVEDMLDDLTRYLPEKR